MVAARRFVGVVAPHLPGTSPLWSGTSPARTGRARRANSFGNATIAHSSRDRDEIDDPADSELHAAAPRLSAPPRSGGLVVERAGRSRRHSRSGSRSLRSRRRLGCRSPLVQRNVSWQS